MELIMRVKLEVDGYHQKLSVGGTKPGGGRPV